MLGSDACKLFSQQGIKVRAFSKDNLDLRLEAKSLASEFQGVNVIVNCVAYTSVDLAERNPKAAFFANATVPAKLATIAGFVGAKFIHVSTDYVFDGEASSPYQLTSKPNPKTIYGRTKLQGEEKVSEYSWSQIVRTSWLYGANRQCFPKKVASSLLRGQTLSVVEDQVGCPTSTIDLSRFIFELVKGDSKEILFHGVSSGSTSWFGFAKHVARSLDQLSQGARPQGIESFRELVTPTLSARGSGAVNRPHYSVLKASNLANYQIPSWLTSWTRDSESVLNSVIVSQPK